MRTPLLSLFLFPAMVLNAQVELDGPIEFTGPPAERTVEGLAHPVSQDAAITVEASLSGVANWSTAVVVGNSITLTPVGPLTAYRNGQLLRFLAPMDVFGNTTVGCAGQEQLPVVRPDGLVPARGQIRTGAIIEVLLIDQKWVLMNAPDHSCPAGTIAINEQVCVERASAANSLFYGAMERCARLGGRSCTWGEFYIACNEHGAEMTGLLEAWEWIDDTSNHAHSAVQVGLGSCTAQRSAHPEFTTFGRSRCCFEIR